MSEVEIPNGSFHMNSTIVQKSMVTDSDLTKKKLCWHLYMFSLQDLENDM